MMREVSGFTVTRTIPDKVLFEVLTGAYEVCGGVVRNNAGQIVAHLVNAVNPLNSVQPSNAVLDAINTYQLSRIGRDVTKIGAGLSDHLITLSNGTMLFSGLTLAVSTAGFAFLIMKQQETDQKLQELQKDVKEIKDFLNMKQRAELKNALKNLQDVSDAPCDETRRHLLVDTRQTLGVLRHHYQMQFEEAGFQGKVSASEEYFTISAIAHALCTGELDMHETAALSLQESYTRWSEMCRKVAKEKLLRSDPQRFLSRRYASRVRTDELIDWMEFAHADEKGIGWVDELRAKPTKGTASAHSAGAGLAR